MTNILHIALHCSSEEKADIFITKIKPKIAYEHICLAVGNKKS